MPVGHYGNGFKSGSMRLGKDAIVLTKTGNTRSVGFLSQTYLEAINAETILVPMVTWDSDGNILYYFKIIFLHERDMNAIYLNATCRIRPSVYCISAVV